jgi:hypothetical protein
MENLHNVLVVYENHPENVVLYTGQVNDDEFESLKITDGNLINQSGYDEETEEANDFVQNIIDSLLSENRLKIVESLQNIDKCTVIRFGIIL